MTPRQKQLVQLRRYAPDLHRQAITGQVTTGQAMIELLVRFNEPEPVFVSSLEWFEPCDTCGEHVQEGVPCPRCNPPVLFDLVVATQKYGYGETENATDPIIWYKKFGEPRQKPRGRTSVADWASQGLLDGYNLVATEVHPTQLIRKYRRSNGQH